MRRRRLDAAASIADLNKGDFLFDADQVSIMMHRATVSISTATGEASSSALGGPRRLAQADPVRLSRPALSARRRYVVGKPRLTASLFDLGLDGNANTTIGTVIITDGNTAYRRLLGRTHDEINLSAEDAPAAHIALPWIHRVFSNFKRWASGTYHGIREKHVDIYCNEFVFRWNRRRHFQTNIDTMLGLGHKIGQVTWRGIVGDTLEWKHGHFDQIVSMLKPERYAEALYYMYDHRVDFFDALDEIRRREPKKVYRRKRAIRSVLPHRRPGEERNTRRYIHPPKLPDDFPSEFLLIPINSKITGSRPR